VSENPAVHRLVDMVVEEVSLVDRAANKHRFLVVKRDETMDEDTDSKETPEVETETQKQEGWPWMDGSPFALSVAALESLTTIVEMLSQSEGVEDERLQGLASELRSVADQILASLETPEEPAALEGDTEEVEADESEEATKAETTGAPKDDGAGKNKRKHAKSPRKASKSSDGAGGIDALKDALSRLTELLVKAKPSTVAPAPATEPKSAAPAVPTKSEKADEPAKHAGTADVSELAGSVAKLADSVQALSESVKEQGQRLGRVEKQFGVPNSAALAERRPKPAPQEVGWPLDLNRPMDRESVDKAVSFHDP
jgi:hypothetical protein